jgi:hypothetical protein
MRCKRARAVRRSSRFCGSIRRPDRRGASNLILNINVEVRNVATGGTVYAKSVDMRGNTDEAWLRGARRLVDNIAERGHHLH